MSLPAQKKIAIHPGQVLRNMLGELGVSQSALARHLGTDHAKINMICKGKRGITADMAYRLGKSFRTGPEFWMNLQKNWELSQLEEAAYADIVGIAGVAA